MNKTIALVGNPNVGKSTIFNSLTGMHQHTGNWTGKTVGKTSGRFRLSDERAEIIDLPGTYSLSAQSQEEEITRDFIFFGEYSDIICVVDSTNLKRNLLLLLQILEFTPKVTVCANLCDEAQKKNISIDFDEFALWTNCVVVPTSATRKLSASGIEKLKNAVNTPEYRQSKAIDYGDSLEKAITLLSDECKALFPQFPARFTALRFLENNEAFIANLKKTDLQKAQKLEESARYIRNLINISAEQVQEMINIAILNRAEQICRACIKRDRPQKAYITTADKIFTSPVTGIPIMLLMLFVIFYITIAGANYPSQILARLFETITAKCEELLGNTHLSTRMCSFLCDGILATLGRIISVMLPPMAIFFPLFTILEDFGYLPRVAFNLDRFFQKAGTSGKQSLTMCTGLGCNACGITNCRIIDSQRERSIAIMTNGFIPCNGKFPTLIAITTMFFANSTKNAFLTGAIHAFSLTVLLVISVICTFAASRLLSMTLCKGESSGFALELVPLRKPQIGKVIVRSVFDRTVKILLRALCVALPAGAIIWAFANITINDVTILSHCADFLDPFASFFGLDGVILLAFILGFPANEIVMPIIIMAYTFSDAPTDFSSLDALRQLLISNGWTLTTAICTLLFSLLHFPCATSCLTIFKETKSITKTVAAFLLPTIFGLVICALIAHIMPIFI